MVPAPRALNVPASLTGHLAGCLQDHPLLIARYATSRSEVAASDAETTAECEPAQTVDNEDDNSDEKETEQERELPDEPAEEDCFPPPD